MAADCVVFLFVYFKILVLCQENLKEGPGGRIQYFSCKWTKSLDLK